jgi:hypothetical protein
MKMYRTDNPIRGDAPLVFGRAALFVKTSAGRDLEVMWLVGPRPRRVFGPRSPGQSRRSQQGPSALGARPANSTAVEVPVLLKASTPAIPGASPPTDGSVLAPPDTFVNTPERGRDRAIRRWLTSCQSLARIRRRSAHFFERATFRWSGAGFATDSRRCGRREAISCQRSRSASPSGVEEARSVTRAAPIEEARRKAARPAHRAAAAPAPPAAPRVERRSRPSTAGPVRARSTALATSKA